MTPRGRSDAPPPPTLPSELSGARSPGRPLSSPPPGGARAAHGARRRVLVVDDEPQVRRSLARLLLARGFEALTAEDGAAALALLATTTVDVLLVDLAMPEMSGLELIERSKQARPDVEIIAMAGLGDLDAVPAAVRAGAFGFVNKPPVLEDEVSIAVARAADKRELTARARSLEERLEHHERFGEIIGQSPRIKEAQRVAMAAAPALSPVLILGESGTGKDLFARAIHRYGGRSSRPLTVIDCGAIPPELIELELFGADGDALLAPRAAVRPGLLELADKGTVLLDAVSDLPLTAQAKLVQLLARGELTRAAAPGDALRGGGSGGDAVQVSVRVLAAAPADLRAHVAAGRFREDLFYRLGVISIHLPPLRQRKEDIPLLAYSFLEKHARRAGREVKKISIEALRRLRDHAWPGNVRELENAMERAVVLSRGDAILPVDLPFASDEPSDQAPSSGAKGSRPSASVFRSDLPYPDAKERVLDAFDRDYIKGVMESAGGNVSEAARRAGMDRSNFRRLLRKLKGGKASGQ